MIHLYVKDGCLFCKKVLDALKGDTISAEYTTHNIAEEEHAEVVRAGGQLQVPYMIDDGTDTKMYESDDIISYLSEHYSG